MAGKKMRAVVRVAIEVEFEDDGENAIVDQAHEAAMEHYSHEHCLEADFVSVEVVE